jgi:hypothetical protein
MFFHDVGAAEKWPYDRLVCWIGEQVLLFCSVDTQNPSVLQP